MPARSRLTSHAWANLGQAPRLRATLFAPMKRLVLLGALLTPWLCSDVHADRPYKDGSIYPRLVVGLGLGAGLLAGLIAAAGSSARAHY